MGYFGLRYVIGKILNRMNAMTVSKMLFEAVSWSIILTVISGYFMLSQ